MFCGLYFCRYTFSDSSAYYLVRKYLRSMIQRWIIRRHVFILYKYCEYHRLYYLRTKIFSLFVLDWLYLSNSSTSTFEGSYY